MPPRVRSRSSRRSRRECSSAHPAFADLSSWRRWLALGAALCGEPLDAEGQAIFCHHTGLPAYAPPPGGWWEDVLEAGRQAGKTLFATTWLAFEAVTAPPGLPDPDRESIYDAADSG